MCLSAAPPRRLPQTPHAHTHSSSSAFPLCASVASWTTQWRAGARRSPVPRQPAHRRPPVGTCPSWWWEAGWESSAYVRVCVQVPTCIVLHLRRHPSRCAHRHRTRSGNVEVTRTRQPKRAKPLRTNLKRWRWGWGGAETVHVNDDGVSKRYGAESGGGRGGGGGPPQRYARGEANHERINSPPPPSPIARSAPTPRADDNSDFLERGEIENWDACGVRLPRHLLFLGIVLFCVF